MVPNSPWIASRHHAPATGGTDWGMGKRIGESAAFIREFVDVGCAGVCVTVTTKMASNVLALKKQEIEGFGHR